MAQPAKHNRAWTPKDIADLKLHYRKGTLHREIAKGLKRTLNAVESKATELGLVSKRRKK
jgi:sorbitol-specific phosphotransferase system component IIA